MYAGPSETVTPSTAKRSGDALVPFAALGLGLLVVALVGCVGAPDPGKPLDPDANLSRSERLGRSLFNDGNLSVPQGTSCAACHSPERAFGGNHGLDSGVPFGSTTTGPVGFRNTPSIMYGSYSPDFALVFDAGSLTPTGGQFLDGRSNTQADQAKIPLLSVTEMNNPDAASVVAKVALSAYAAQFQAEYGADIFARTDDAFNAIAKSLQDYEHSTDFHPFSSRYDDYLRGHDTFTAQERRGMALFFNADKGNCNGCHAADQRNPDPTASLFTDFTYDNLGVPRNTDIPANADPTFFDLGLGGPKRSLPGDVPDPGLNGAFKVPTLRNAAVKQALFHNGRFKTLEDLVAFYVTRDTDPARWYPSGTKFDDLPPEFRANVNTAEVPYDRHPGEEPHLNAQEQADLVAFLRTLTDAQFVPLLPPPRIAN